MSDTNKKSVTIDDIDKTIRKAEEGIRSKESFLQRLNQEVKEDRGRLSRLRDARELLFPEECQPRPTEPELFPTDAIDLSEFTIAGAVEVLLKQSSEVYLSADRLCELLKERGLDVNPNSIMISLRRRPDRFKLKRRRGRLRARLVSKPQPDAKITKPQERDMGRFASMTAARAAAVVLEEHGAEMHVKKIAESLQEGGYPHGTNGNQLYTTLIACLSQKKATFVRVKPATYDLKERYDKLNHTETSEGKEAPLATNESGAKTGVER